MPALAGPGTAISKAAETAPNSTTAGHFNRLLREKSTTGLLSQPWRARNYNVPLAYMVPAARFGDSGRVQDRVTTSYQAPVKGEYAATARICCARSHLVIPGGPLSPRAGRGLG